MSRFYEGDGWESDEEELAFERRLALAYQEASSDLGGFLAHLDAMPVKKIIANRFMAPSTGAACAVAEFCRYKGATREQMLNAERDSRLERLENEGPEDGGGWDGTTINMGVKYGLPEVVAYNLAWKNDLAWEQVEDGVKEIPGVRGRLADGDTAEKTVNWWARLIPDENGPYWIAEPIREKIYRDMTPEERWLHLRNHVARKIGSPTIQGV